MNIADFYDWLNHLFGTPTRVAPGTHLRSEAAFQKHSLPLLEIVALNAASDARVLIIGCGDGVEVEWFCRRCASVVAVDVRQLGIDRSAERNADCKNVSYRLVDGRTLPFADAEFDLVYMHNVCEHIINLDDCFQEYFRVLKPGAHLVNVFSPLFYSPFGAHLTAALKMPWGHLIFGVRAVVDVRNRYYPDHAEATTWAELGLSRITEGRYRKLAKRIGFRNRLLVTHSSRNLPLLAYIPFVRNLFIVGIQSILEKPKTGVSHVTQVTS